MRSGKRVVWVVVIFPSIIRVQSGVFFPVFHRHCMWHVLELATRVGSVHVMYGNFNVRIHRFVLCKIVFFPDTQCMYMLTGWNTNTLLAFSCASDIS